MIRYAACFYFMMVIQFTIPSQADNAKEAKAHNLDWQLIAETFDSNANFCWAVGPRQEQNATSMPPDFAFDPNVSAVKLLYPAKLIKDIVSVKNARRKDKLWVELANPAVKFDTNDIEIGIGTLMDGFYRASISSKTKAQSPKTDWYFIKATDWKKDLLAYCKGCKEQIETNPDQQLIFSSIAVSHFDNVMSLAISSQSLTDNIIKTLAKAIEAKAVYEQGKCPDLIRGINKIRFKRFEGSVIEEFVVVIPATYDAAKPEAVFLYPDSPRWGPLNNYRSISAIIDIWWHTVTNKDINWKNYHCFFEILKQKLNIDLNRIYVHGECENGLAAISLALIFPDQWAECSASMGNTYRHLAGNAFNLPVIFAKGDHNEENLVRYYDFAVECFKYRGCRNFNHSNTLTTWQIRGSSTPTEIRNLSPARVFYTIESRANTKAYWVQIDGREDENFNANIDAIVWGQQILVRTQNVDAYTLDVNMAPIDHTRPIEIIENGISAGKISEPIFKKKNDKYTAATYIKDVNLHGPVYDVFTEPYIVVWEGDAVNFAKQIAGTGPICSDANLKSDAIKTKNIVFVGRLQNSKLLGVSASQLPISISDQSLTVQGSKYEGDIGAILIYPNPLNCKKYIAVFTATSDKAMAALGTGWAYLNSNTNADIGIYKLLPDNSLQWIRCENFDSTWGWQKSWAIPLIKIAKAHPRWKWNQLAAKAFREQLEADVVICEDPFESSELPQLGELTLRDIARIFKNDWIVKIRLNGKDLRRLLTVPFNDILSRETSDLVIDGIVMTTQACNSLTFAELVNDKYYTVCLPYKAVNGKRLGLALKNYHIENDGFSVLLLKDYFMKNHSVDAVLDRMQLNVF